MANLFDKIYGCLAASRIGSAMGAVVEGWSTERIEQEYGYLEELKSYRHYYPRTNWQRPPGTTEDGIERQKLMCQAIIEKKDRITVDDLGAIWLKYLDPVKIVYKSEPGEVIMLGHLQANIPPCEVGRLNDSQHGTNSMSRGGQALGLINAADPQSAVDDTRDVSRMMFSPIDVAIDWACVAQAAIAAALAPNATVDSVVNTACNYITSEAMRKEIERGLDLAHNSIGDPMKLRVEFYKIYNGFGTPYAFASANETVTKALAVLVCTQGDPKLSITTGVNFGRDTDCLAATSGGFSGALNGLSNISTEWIEQVDAATLADPYTNTVCTIRQHAEGIYAALQCRAEKMQQLAQIYTA